MNSPNARVSPAPMDLTKMSDEELELLLVSVPREIEARRMKREAELLAFIREQIAAKSISPARLRTALFGKLSTHKRPSAPEDKRSEVRPKYRDPRTGTTWSGRGGAPKWFTEHIAAGGTKDELRIPEGEQGKP